MNDDALLASDVAADAASAPPSVARRISSSVSRGLLAGTLALGLAVGCREEDPPAARLTASPGLVRLAYPECVPFRLEWTPLAPLRRADMHPTVFVHLIDRPNHVLQTFDHALPGPWTVGVTQ